MTCYKKKIKTILACLVNIMLVKEVLQIYNSDQAAMFTTKADVCHLIS